MLVDLVAVEADVSQVAPLQEVVTLLAHLHQNSTVAPSVSHQRWSWAATSEVSSAQNKTMLVMIDDLQEDTQFKKRALRLNLPR